MQQIIDVFEILLFWYLWETLGEKMLKCVT